MSDIEEEYHRNKDEYGNASGEPVKDYTQTWLGAAAHDLEQLLYFGRYHGLWRPDDERWAAIEEARQLLSGVSAGMDDELREGRDDE